MKKFAILVLGALLATVGLLTVDQATAAEGDTTPANASYFVLPVLTTTVTNGQEVTVVQSMNHFSANGAAASNNVTLAVPTVNGLQVQIVNIGTNLIHFADSSNVKLAGVFTTGQYDSLSLVGDTNSSTWIETSRSDN